MSQREDEALIAKIRAVYTPEPMTAQEIAAAFDTARPAPPRTRGWLWAVGAAGAAAAVAFAMSRPAEEREIDWLTPLVEADSATLQESDQDALPPDLEALALLFDEETP
jgi:hypothetical protein